MKIIKYLSIIAITLLFGACSDYIDIAQEDTLPRDEVDFSNADYIEGLSSGAYAQANSKLSFWALQGLNLVRGDDYNRGGGPGDQPQFDQADSFDYEGLNNFWALQSTWDGMYGIINTVNRNLLTVDEVMLAVGGDADIQKRGAQSKAEMRFLRAYAYFQLVKLFEGVPIITEDIDPFQNYNRVKPEGVLQFIVDEMEIIADDLPKARPNQNAERIGAVTSYSALALKAKAALYLGDYQTTLDASNKIIESGLFSLYPEFRDLFKIKSKLSNESLFELQFTDFGQGQGDIVKSDLWYGFQGPNNKTSEGANVTGLNGWGFMSHEDSFLAFMEARQDSVRLEGTALGQGVTRDGDTIRSLETYPDTYNYKAYTPLNELTPGRTGYGDGNNVRVLRYADVLLMNAEARIMLNGSGSGDAQINEVRERAKMAPISGATLDDLLDERLAELAGEWGNRFWDLVRTDKAAQALGAKGYVKGQSEYYPLPQAAVDLNPLLLEEPIEYTKK